MSTGSRFRALGVVWGLALLAWVVLLAGEWFLISDVACPLDPGTSVFGTARWSWLPPGRTCSWELPAGTHTDGPPFARLGMLLLFVLWGASLLLLRRRDDGSAN